MDIVLLSLGMPFDGETIYKASLGGSETAAYYLARELARRGHRTSLFTTTDKDEVYDGVRYCSVGNVSAATPLGDRFEFYTRNTPHDVLILQRHPEGYHRRFQSKISIWQTHDLALYRYAGRVNHGLWAVDAVTCVSEWHRKQTLGVYTIDPDYVQVVPNAVDLGLYEESPDWSYIAAKLPKDFPWEKKFKLLYQARPERGLDHLVRPGGIMARLLKEAPHVHLLIAGYDNTQPSMEDAYSVLCRMADQLPNVTRVGACDKPHLARLQKACDVMVYPTEFEEVSCISAMEAMAAGLPFVSSVCGALPETCEGSGSTLFALKDGVADEDAFVEELLARGSGRRDDPAESELQCLTAKSKSWEAATEALEKVIDNAFTRRRGSKASQLRHCIEHGDIMLAQELAKEVDLKNPIETQTKAELHQLYEFTTDRKKFETHYRKHQSKYYDEFEERVIGEDITQTNRFQGVSMYMLMQERMHPPQQPLRVMDYGCAHGHYLMPFAKFYQDWRFLGVDISGRAIAAATRWAQRDQVRNVEFVVGDDQIFNTLSRLCPMLQVDEQQVAEDNAQRETLYTPDLFDVIIAGEVLEHSPDPIKLLNQFTTALRPGGVIIATTPCGRWEWTGHDAFKSGREHLWHFERADIEELCGDQDFDISHATAGHDETGTGLGSYVWCVRWDGTPAPFKPYDRERKLKYLTPRQTISAALIVKDGERTLRKALDSVDGWADEFVIAIDPATKDNTRDIIARWSSSSPWTPVKVIDGVEALKEGFHTARNRTVEECVGDWILWFDSDEEVQRPAELWKFARASSFRGFGFPQVHYAFDPPQVLTTDFPCRLFRRGKVQFYGVVHEHPEEELGKAIPFSSIRHETQMLHSGYVDEKVRRERFLRNLPLLHRDMKTYPDRGLNRFLWLRDIAQGIGYELEQNGGRPHVSHWDRAKEAIALYEKMVEKDTVRLLIDALQYYSLCVGIMGTGGFEAELQLKAQKEVAPDLSVNLTARGRFHSREFYFKLIRKINEESTKYFEDKYL